MNNWYLKMAISLEKFVMNFYKSFGMSEVSKNLTKKLKQLKNQGILKTLSDSADVELQLLDMRIFENKTYILAGAVNTPHTPQMYYGIGKF